MKEVLQKLIAGQNLSTAETVAAFDRIMDGDATPAQLGAFLTALRIKGETVEELTGACASLRRHAVFIDPRGQRVVDTCGTGGDALGTFNISTTAAFVVAGAGVPVAKHGNRSITSKCGSADVLAELGVNLEVSPDVMEECIHEVGIGFLFAPKLHPAMKHAMGPRRELGFRTIFNLLGPLANPAGVTRQLVGVSHPTLIALYRDAMELLGTEAAMIVSGAEGLDELSIAGTSYLATIGLGPIPAKLRPEDAGLSSHPLEELRGGDADYNAAALLRLLDGQPGAYRDAVLLNSAAALLVAGEAGDLFEGVEEAAEALDKGLAKALLDCWIETVR